MRIDIEVEEVKKLNYKHVILVLAIVILIIVCLYIILVLPKKAEVKKEVQNNEEIVQEELPKEPEPQIENYPEITEEGIQNINSIYQATYKRVFLTFDDGPSKTVTPKILDILDEYGIKASFFVLGNRAELYPELIREEYNRGHYIANHGYSHKYDYIYKTEDNVLQEYRKTEEIVRNILGISTYKSNVFRFPGGLPGGKYANIKKSSAEILEQEKIAHIDWNCLTRDSEGTFEKEELIENLINTAGEKTSIVVLMHDSGNKISTYEALPEVIEYFKNNGYVFENLYDVIK